MALIIFITGKPGCGKTTLLKRLLPEIPHPVVGFFTEEIRENKVRTGFRIHTLSGKSGILADLSPGNPKIGKYRVYVEEFESLILPELSTPATSCIIDEIGKMELCSQKFRLLLPRLFQNFPLILATRALHLPRFIEQIFPPLSNVHTLSLTPANREKVFDYARLLLHSFMSNQTPEKSQNYN
ncbi:MAG: nucleoside-triphosphatase [bacterium]